MVPAGSTTGTTPREQKSRFARPASLSRSTMHRAGRMHDLCALLNPILVDSANPNQAIGYFVAETSALLRSLHSHFLSLSLLSSFHRLFHFRHASALFIKRCEKLNVRRDDPLLLSPLQLKNNLPVPPP